jgi:ABC-type sulfate/molybdate transport systems ATPase subunit
MTDADSPERPGLSVEIAHHVGDVSIALAFELTKGTTVLFGPSGSGKSTTLAAIAGLVKPHGTIRLGDETWLDSKKGYSLAVHKRRVAFVFQSHALFPHMTAIANVTYGMDRALTQEERDRRANKLLEQWRVLHVADRKPRTFSGGEAQRVALARAFATSPRVILMDEPFSALDEDLRQTLMRDVKEFIRELGVPALFVTHSKSEAEALGDRVIVLERGKIVREGDVRTTLAPPAAT